MKTKTTRRCRVCRQPKLHKAYHISPAGNLNFTCRACVTKKEDSKRAKALLREAKRRIKIDKQNERAERDREYVKLDREKSQVNSYIRTANKYYEHPVKQRAHKIQVSITKGNREFLENLADSYGCTQEEILDRVIYWASQTWKSAQEKVEEIQRKEQELDDTGSLTI